MIFNERDTWCPSHFWFPAGKLILGCTAITDLKGTVGRSLRVCVVWTHVWLTGHIHIYWTHAHMLLRKALTEEQLDHLGETDRPFKKPQFHWPPWAHCFVFPRRLVLWQAHQHLASSALFMADLTGRYYRCGSLSVLELCCLGPRLWAPSMFFYLDSRLPLPRETEYCALSRCWQTSFRQTAGIVQVHLNWKPGRSFAPLITTSPLW